MEEDEPVFPYNERIVRRNIETIYVEQDPLPNQEEFQESQDTR